MKPNPGAVVIVGPTASGKSAVAMSLARSTGGEIVNADSRQIYKFLDAGTAKPDIRERNSVPHHLYDFLDPKEDYNAGDYARDAGSALNGIISRGKTAIIAGGTGLYIKALFDGLAVLPKKNDTLRSTLLEAAEKHGRKYLHDKLVSIDPAAAANIPYQNIHRVIRALEVYEMTGKPISEFQAGTQKPKFDFAVSFHGLKLERAALIKRITERTDKILPGMVSETKELMEKGYGEENPGFSSIGYRETIQHIKGRISLDELRALVIKGTAAYAKRQMTWFRKDRRISWVEMREDSEAEEIAERIMGQRA